MGAKFVTLAAGSASLNTDGHACKTDADCTATYTSGNKTVFPALTSTADKAKTCCMYREVVKAPSGTTAQAKAGTDEFTTFKNFAGVSNTVGEYNLYCNRDYPLTITDYTTKTTKFASYDSKTGLVT